MPGRVLVCEKVEKGREWMTGKKVFAACLVAMTIVLTAGCSGNMLWASASREPEEVRREAENRMEAVELLGKISIGISTDYGTAVRGCGTGQVYRRGAWGGCGVPGDGI